jgi:hypothetical protein
MANPGDMVPPSFADIVRWSSWLRSSEIVGCRDVDGREVDRKEDNEELNGRWSTGTFAVSGGKEYRFIRLVNIDRSHTSDDGIFMTGWEIFGSLFE